MQVHSSCPVHYTNYLISVFTGSFVMHSDIATMLSHLCKCSLQPLDMTEWAIREYTTKYARSSCLSAPFTPSLMVPSTSLHPSPSHQPMQNTPGLPFHQFSLNPYHPQPMLSPQLSPLHMSPAMVINVPTPLPHLSGRRDLLPS